jgi:hypothetical protein
LACKPTVNLRKLIQMATKKELLTKTVFGSRIAEDEADNLHSYFVETEDWRKVLAGEVDIIFGAKGAGKSALYSLLVDKKEELRVVGRTLFIAAENPRGTPAFRDLTKEPTLSEDKFRSLWKLYFLTIAANYLRHHLTSKKIKNPIAFSIFELLSKNDLLANNVNLITRLKAAYEYLQKYFPSIEGSYTDPMSGINLKGKITLVEPSTEQRGFGFRSLDELLQCLNDCLQNERITCWLALDRLDVAFADSQEFEATSLRALFRVYLDMLALTQIKIKIFLRDDIWKRIVGTGFREASHITRTLTLNWDQQSLQNLVVRRLVSNVHLCDYYNVTKEDVLANVASQEILFNRIFPNQIDIGPSKPTTIGWMLSRTADGSKRTAPRELIHLLLEIRDEQLKRYENGNTEPEDNVFFDRFAIRAALPAVSKARYEQTLCAEYPALKPFLSQLEGERTQHSIESLSKLWKKINQTKAIEIAEKLVEAGFFEKRGSKESPNYWVPFIYRDALSMVQGASG